MPTGHALHDARGVLLDAGVRILAAHGAAALTSRSVTEASGVAKGVLHRHFEDFDDFVAALVAQEAIRIQQDAASIRKRVTCRHSDSSWAIAH